MNISKIKTLGDLKKSGYKSKSIKDELRDNLIISFKESIQIHLKEFMDTMKQFYRIFKLQYYQDIIFCYWD